MKHTKLSMLLVLLFCTLMIGCTPAATPSFDSDTQVKTEAAAPAKAATAPSQAEDDNNLWEVVFETEVEQPVRMAAFLNEAFGLTGGADSAGKAHFTTDGGQTWTMAESSSGCLFGLDIVDDQTIWQCNASDIRLSTDGGQSWQGSPGGRGQPFCQVSSVDGQTVWYLSPRQLRATADGGTTWQDIALPETVPPRDIVTISLRTSSEGYILDYAGNLYTTLDGGQSWSSQSLGLEKYGEMKLMPTGSGASAALRFLDTNHGIIILSLMGGGNSKVVALRTRDGGQTWEEESIPVKVGTPYLTHDGKFLTLHGLLGPTITVLRYGES